MHLSKLSGKFAAPDGWGNWGLELGKSPEGYVVIVDWDQDGIGEWEPADPLDYGLGGTFYLDPDDYLVPEEDIVVTGNTAAYGNNSYLGVWSIVAPAPFWSWDPGDNGLGGTGNWHTTDLNWDNTSPPDSDGNVVWVNGLSAAFEAGSGVVTINDGSAISLYAISFNSPDGAYTINAAGVDDSLNLVGGTITADTDATINAKVTTTDFSKQGSGVLTLNDITGLTGTIDVAAGTLTLGDPVGLPGGVTGVRFGTDSTLVNSSGGLMDWTGRTVTVDGNFHIGAGNAMRFADLDPGADDRVIFIDNDTEVSRFTGDRSDVVFGGTGTLTLTGTDSDFSGSVYIKDDLTVILNGGGQDMLDGPVHLNNNAVLRLAADDQLGSSDIFILDSSTLDVNSRTEMIGRVSLSGPDASIALTTGNLTVTAIGAFVGGATIETGPSGVLTLTESSQVFNRNTDSETVTIGGSGRVNHDGDTNWHVNDSSADIDLRVDAKITGNGLTADGVLSFVGGGTVLLTNPDNDFNMKVSGSRVMISSAGAVRSDEDLKVESKGEVVLNGGRLIVPSVRIDSGGALSGHGTVTGKISTSDGSTITADGGTLTLGDPAQFAAFNHHGELHVGAADVVIETKGFASLGPLTTLAGGTLSTDNGVYVPGGTSIKGYGSMAGRVAADFGSTIAATGDLTLGDSSHVAGFVSDGELYTDEHTVTLHDANQAVLGSLTQLGTDTEDGTLVADSGLLLEFGKNIAGRGVVDTPDNELFPLTNNGVIIGDSPGAIELTGYVNGVGTFENVTVSGTLSPGFSPVRLHATNLGIGSGGTLVMELGGLSGGSEYDQLDVGGELHLGGTLQVSLIDSFVPDIGDTFDVLDFGDLNGTEFDVLELPELMGRRVWDISSLYSTGKISVIAILAGDTDVDWDVDSDDLANLISVFGGEGDLYTDFNEDGRVDLTDFAIMRGNFGFGVESAPDAAFGATTPEPATLSLLTLGSFALVRRRKREVCK